MSLMCLCSWSNELRDLSSSLVAAIVSMPAEEAERQVTAAFLSVTGEQRWGGSDSELLSGWIFFLRREVGKWATGW